MKALLTLLASAAIGLIIWRIDSQPNWDDTGITAGMIVISTALISMVSPKRPFICALAVSIWIPLFGIINHSNYGTLLIFVFGFMGAYGGSALRNSLTLRGK
jgi:hypothetical protein